MSRVAFETALADLLELRARWDRLCARHASPTHPEVLAAEDAWADAHLAFVETYAPRD